MDWLNYHHLYYFWVVARSGSITAACAELDVAQPTVSAQLQALERRIGEKLFARSGRGLQLTEVGQLVFTYANDIFSLGRELQDALKGHVRQRPRRLVVGVGDTMPRLLVERFLEAVHKVEKPIHLVCQQDRPERLLVELAVQTLDVVLLDTPLGNNARVRGFNHLLGECGISWYAAPDLAARLSGSFPHCLQEAPVLMPLGPSTLRQGLENWLERNHLTPVVRGEFQDSTMMMLFGQRGAGAFAAPSVLDAEITASYQVRVLGHIEDIRERYYAISADRRPRHPGVVALCEAARTGVFGR